MHLHSSSMAETISSLPLFINNDYKTSSTGILLFQTTRRIAKLLAILRPLIFCFNFFAKIGLFSARQASFKLNKGVIL